MNKLMSFLAMLFVAFLPPRAYAGDMLFDQWIYVVGSISDDFAPIGETLDLQEVERFLQANAKLRAEYGAQCGVNLDVWHSALMGAEIGAPLAKGYYIAFFMREAKSEDTSFAGKCTGKGVWRKVSIGSPTNLYTYVDICEDGYFGAPDVEGAIKMDPSQFGWSCDGY